MLVLVRERERNLFFFSRVNHPSRSASLTIESRKRSLHFSWSRPQFVNTDPALHMNGDSSSKERKRSLVCCSLLRQVSVTLTFFSRGAKTWWSMLLFSSSTLSYVYLQRSDMSIDLTRQKKSSHSPVFACLDHAVEYSLDGIHDDDAHHRSGRWQWSSSFIIDQIARLFLYSSFIILWPAAGSSCAESDRRRTLQSISGEQIGVGFRLYSICEFEWATVEERTHLSDKN